jgi:hypothetical protein
LALSTKVPALLNDKHLAHTNHTHTLLFLKSMINEQIVYRVREFSVTQ